jgi:hypothetical protein
MELDMEPVRFYSKEWAEKVRELTQTDEEYLKKTKGFTAKYLFVITDDPDGNDIKILWDFNQGKLQNVTYETAPAPSNFRVGKEHWDDSISMAKNEGAYETFAKVRRGEMTVLGTMGAKLMKVEGDLIKGMSMMAYNVAFAALQDSIPVYFTKEKP